MKILYTNFHRRNGGGHVTYIVNLLKTLGGAHRLTVATPGSSRLYRYAGQVPGVTVVDMSFTSRALAMAGEVRRLRALLKKEKYDVVHVNASADHRHVMLACAGLHPRPRIVWTKHNDHPVQSLGHWIRARLATDQAIAVSAFVKDMLLASAYRRVPMHVVRHGIDTDYFSPPDPQEKRELRRRLFGPVPDGLFVLGSSGGTDYDKGWLDLLAAVARLPAERRARVRVVVAGDPPDARKMRRVSDLGLAGQVVFPGLVDDVRPVLGACDAGFVLSYREALSYACRETLSLGLPTLVSDAGGLPENVQNGVDGWIVPARGVAEIVLVLEQMLAEPGGLARMADAARRKSRDEFTLERFARSTLDVYEQACLGPSPAARR